MASISLLSVNIERSKHLDLVSTFLQVQQPDVVCMQELMEYDIPHFEEILGCACHFAPETRYPANDRPGIMGNGIFSRLPAHYGEQYYYGARDVMHDFDFSNTERKHATEAHVLSWCDIEKDGRSFRIATTHFTWTAKGEPDDFQRHDIKVLLEILGSSGKFVLTGDFNAPRMYEGKPGEIFAQLAARYKDNIPLSYMTSLDPARHRAPIADQADKMVDGLFTTSAYIASDVALHAGVSDHCAITATITRN